MSKNIDKQIQWIFKDKYAGKWMPGILDDIRRLKTGEPIDYIIGWKPFLNCKIDLLYKPLIPRPETEFWTEKFINENKDNALTLKIADVFSGSGCIGIAVLKNIKNSKVDFYELDENLIKQIKINLKINGISKSRYKVIQANIFNTKESLNLSKSGYNFILANPPYLPALATPKALQAGIALLKKDKVQKSVLKFEPKKALFSGKDGLVIIKKFIKQASQYIKTDGQIWIEFDSFQKPLINQILKKSGYSNWEFYKDQYGKWRYVKIIT